MQDQRKKTASLFKQQGGVMCSGVSLFRVLRKRLEGKASTTIQYEEGVAIRRAGKIFRLTFFAYISKVIAILFL